MLFNSLTFLYAFLPITYLVFWSLRSKQQRYLWLTLTGYVFYAFWNYKFCALMAASTLVSYAAGLGLRRWADPARRRACLIIPIAIDLSFLLYFKYTNFGLDTIDTLSRWFGYPIDLPVLNIVLPVGISFYTFHTITYIVDSYRGTIRPTTNLFEFSCYVSLFAQLVAGPIVRFGQIERDLENIDHAERTTNLDVAWSFVALGFFKKILIADSIARIIDPALAQHATLSTPMAWLVMIGYTYQLYFDFSGYSDMAIGLGLMFGLRLPQNFNSPYKAVDIADFWRRWHISLSTVLRDYLYIPLGGSRGGRVATYRNLMITMLLGGLWHGAAWTFVIWGAYHGALLCLHRAIGDQWSKLHVGIRRVATFVLVVIGWVFFRAANLPMALDLLGAMFSPRTGQPVANTPALVAVLAVAGLIAHAAPNTFELSHQWRPATVSAIAGLFIVCLVVLYAGHESPFLYFQF